MKKPDVHTTINEIDEELFDVEAAIDAYILVLKKAYALNCISNNEHMYTGALYAAPLYAVVFSNDPKLFWVGVVIFCFTYFYVKWDEVTLMNEVTVETVVFEHVEKSESDIRKLLQCVSREHRTFLIEIIDTHENARYIVNYAVVPDTEKIALSVVMEDECKRLHLFEAPVYDYVSAEEDE